MSIFSNKLSLLTFFTAFFKSLIALLIADLFRAIVLYSFFIVEVNRLIGEKNHPLGKMHLAMKPFLKP